MGVILKGKWRDYFRKDPDGYYVAKIDKKYAYMIGNDFIKINLGSHILIKTKSRSKFMKLLRKIGLI